jgi:hypothetical protein
MAFDGTGSFERIYSWATDKINNIRILASRMDTEHDGFAVGLSTCVTKDGQTTTTARVPFALGVGLSGSSVINPGGSLSLIPTGGSASRHIGDVLGETINPKAFGAVGDGVTDDTTALQAWVARLNAVGGLGYIPPGIYLCTARLLFTGKSVRIEGDGVNSAVLRFTSATAGNKGIAYAPDGGGSPYGGCVVRNLSLHTTTAGGVAIDALFPNDGEFSKHTRVFVENVDILAPVSGYWANGVKFYNVSYSTISNVKYLGSIHDPAADAGYYAGVGFQIGTQIVSDTITLGLSLENRVINCTANFCQYGLFVDGFSEGVYALGCNFLSVRKGVYAAAAGAVAQKLICVMATHIDATDACIHLGSYPQSHVGGCLLSRPDTSANATFNGDNWIGVLLSNASDTTVSDNQIVAEFGTAAAGTFYGVYCDQFSLRIGVDNNRFVGAAGNAMDVGVVFDATTSACKLSDSNQYSLVTTAVSDAGAGNNTLGFYFTTPIAKQTVVGSRGGNAALADLLTSLANLGLITDSTTA